MLAKDILKEFIFECEIRKFTLRTIKGYRNNNALFLTFVEKEYKIDQIEGITHLHIKQYFQYLIQRKLAETYINGILKSLRAFYKYCVHENYISESPCKCVSWQKEPKVLIHT